MKALLLFAINIWVTAVLSEKVHRELGANQIISQNGHDVSKETESEEFHDFLKKMKHYFEQKNYKVQKLKSNDDGSQTKKTAKRYKVVIGHKRKRINDSAITENTKKYRFMIKEKHNNKYDSLADSTHLIKQTNNERNIYKINSNLNRDSLARLEKVKEAETPIKWDSRNKTGPFIWKSRSKFVNNGELNKYLSRNRSHSKNKRIRVSSSLKRKKYKGLESSAHQDLLNSEEKDSESNIYEKEGSRSKWELNNGYNVVQNKQELGSNERILTLNAKQNTDYRETHSRPNLYAKKSSKTTSNSWKENKEHKVQNIAKLEPYVEPNPSIFSLEKIPSKPENYVYINDILENSPNEWKAKKHYKLVLRHSQQQKSGLKDKEINTLETYNSQNGDVNSIPSAKVRENFEKSREIANDWYDSKQFEQRYPIPKTLNLEKKPIQWKQNKQPKLVLDEEEKAIKWKVSKNLKLVPNYHRELYNDNDKNYFEDTSRIYFTQKPLNNLDLTGEDISDQKELSDEENSLPLKMESLKRKQWMPWIEKNLLKLAYSKSDKLEPNSVSSEKITINRSRNENDNLALNQIKLDSTNEEDISEEFSGNNVYLKRNNETKLTTKQQPQSILETKELVPNNNDYSNEESNKLLTINISTNSENTIPLSVIPSVKAVNPEENKVSFGVVGANDEDIEDKDQENDSTDKINKENVSNETDFKDKLTLSSLSNKESLKEWNALTSKKTSAQDYLEKCKQKHVDFDTVVHQLGLDRSENCNDLEKLLELLLAVAQHISRFFPTLKNQGNKILKQIISILNSEKFSEDQLFNANKNGAETVVESAEPYLSAKELSAMPPQYHEPLSINNANQTPGESPDIEEKKNNLEPTRTFQNYLYYVPETLENVEKSVSVENNNVTLKPIIQIQKPDRDNELLEEDVAKLGPKLESRMISEPENLKGLNVEKNNLIQDIEKNSHESVQNSDSNDNHSYSNNMDLSKRKDNNMNPEIINNFVEIKDNLYVVSNSEIDNKTMFVRKNNDTFDKSNELQGQPIGQGSPEQNSDNSEVTNHENLLKQELKNYVILKLTLNELGIKDNVNSQITHQNSESKGQNLESRENQEGAGQNKDKLTLVGDLLKSGPNLDNSILPIPKPVQTINIVDKYKNSVNPKRMINSREADRNLESAVIEGQKGDKSPLQDELSESSLKIESGIILKPKNLKTVQNSLEQNLESGEVPHPENLKEIVPESKQNGDNFENGSLDYHGDANPENLETPKVTNKTNMNPNVDNFLQPETKLEDNEMPNSKNLIEPDAAEKKNVNLKSDKVTNSEKLEESLDSGGKNVKQELGPKLDGNILNKLKENDKIPTKQVDYLKELVPSENVAVSNPEELAEIYDMLNYFYELETNLEKVPNTKNLVNSELADSEIEMHQNFIFDEFQSNEDLLNNPGDQIDLKHIDYALIQTNLLGIFKKICQRLRERHVPERLIKEIANKILVITLHKIEEKTVKCAEKMKFDKFVHHLKGEINNYLVETTMVNNQNLGKNELREIFSSSEMKKTSEPIV